MKVRDVLIEGENKKKFPVYGLGINISSFNLVSLKLGSGSQDVKA